MYYSVYFQFFFFDMNNPCFVYLIFLYEIYKYRRIVIIRCIPLYWIVQDNNNNFIINHFIVTIETPASKL